MWRLSFGFFPKLISKNGWRIFICLLWNKFPNFCCSYSILFPCHLRLDGRIKKSRWRVAHLRNEFRSGKLRKTIFFYKFPSSPVPSPHHHHKIVSRFFFLYFYHCFPRSSLVKSRSSIYIFLFEPIWKGAASEKSHHSSNDAYFYDECLPIFVFYVDFSFAKFYETVAQWREKNWP